jgi:hypothetical protein
MGELDFLKWYLIFGKESREEYNGEPVNFLC